MTMGHQTKFVFPVHGRVVLALNMLPCANDGCSVQIIQSVSTDVRADKTEGHAVNEMSTDGIPNLGNGGNDGSLEQGSKYT